MTEHATFAPSSAYQWGPDRCPGSLQMQRKHPADDDTEASREGTEAHWVATELVQGRVVPSNQEMRDGAALFAEAAEGSQWVERKLSMQTVHPECFGTPDAVRYDTGARTLEVIDYKYGHGYVEHWHNPQLLLYAIGALEELHVIDWAGWSITLTIVQPRFYGVEGPVRSCTLTGQFLQSIWLPRFKEAARLAEDPGALCKTGPWCRYCPALLHCEAARKMQGAAMDYTDRQESGPVTAESVGSELTHIARALRILKDRQTALEAQAEVMPRVMGWSKQPKYGNLAWTESNEDIIQMGDALGIDLRRPAAPVTPTQAKKLIDDSVISEYAERPFAGIKLLPEKNAEEILK